VNPVTDYVLRSSSFVDTVPGASHYRGRVEGPHPKSCHGGTVFHGAPGPLQGKTTCAQDHVLPDREEWQVDADWTRARYDRWAARDFEGDGPGQFTSEAALIDAAVRRFRGEIPVTSYLEPHVPGKPGDRLWFGFIAAKPEQAYEDGWGTVIAEIPAEAEGEPATRPRARCPYCGRRKAVTSTGKIWSHKQKGAKLKCGGSGQPA
jgi:hypothetical protein